MKKNLLLLLLLSCSFYITAAQITQAEIDKMLKDAQELIKKSGANNNAGNNSSNTYSDPGDYGNVDNWKFPARKIVLLNAIPKKIFTKPELVIFLNNLYLQLSNKFQVTISSSVQKIAARYNNDGNKMGDAAVGGWYTDYREEALLLILKAAINSPDNGLLLNNCAALLNMSGIEQTAIPILKYVLQSYPASSMLLNNLGQAYAGLGETDTAMVYLGRSIKIDPENSEANNTAGQIEATKGNKQKAAEYFEQSLKSAYSKPAALKLSKIKKGSRLSPLVRPRIKLPEYFNLFKYDLPAQCIKIEQAITARAEHDAFADMITKQAQAYSSRLLPLQQKVEQFILQYPNAMPRQVKKNEFMAQSYYGLCTDMAADVWDEYLAEIDNFYGMSMKKYNVDMETLEKEYNSKRKLLSDAGAGCDAINNLGNQYLPKYAYFSQEMQNKGLQIYQKYFDELTYWHYLAFMPTNVGIVPTGKERFQMFYYELIIKYLVMLGGLNNMTRIIEPCDYTPPGTSAIDSNAIAEIECPLEIEIPFIVGKFEINCEKFSFKAGEGAIFSYEKVFKTKQSTVSVGIGAKFELEAKLGPLKGGVSTSIGETIFITFDGDNKFSDGGLKVDAKASAGVEAEAGNKVKGKKDIVKKETGVGVSFGINSGCNFNEGPFKGMIGPKAETPLNKNVKTYKPN